MPRRVRHRAGRRAHLSLGRHADRRFGFLALDAFSSDAIPTHLLTREAMELYRAKLTPHGVLAFHISNRYLDLEPEVGAVAHQTGMACYAQADLANKKELRRLKHSSHWIAMARSERDLGAVRVDPRWHPCRRDRDARPWTDDYSNVLRALRWR